MNQQFLNRQYLNKSINPQMQGFGQSLNQIPNYSPQLQYSRQNQVISPSIQSLQPQQQQQFLLQQQQQQQQQLPPGPNQKYFMQNVPLVQSLPQNFAANHFQATAVSPIQFNSLMNNMNKNQKIVSASSTSSTQFFSQNNEQTQQQQNKQQIQNSNYYSTGNKYSSSNNNAITANTYNSNNGSSLQNFNDNRSISQLSYNNSNNNNNEVLHGQSSSKTNSINYGNSQNLLPAYANYIQKTPERIQLKQQNVFQFKQNVSPSQLVSNQDKQAEDSFLNVLSNEPNRQDQRIQLAKHIQQLQPHKDAQQDTKAQFYDVDKIKQLKNLSGVSNHNLHPSKNTLQIGQQQQQQQQKSQTQEQVTRKQNDSKDDHYIYDQRKQKEQNRQSRINQSKKEHSSDTINNSPKQGIQNGNIYFQNNLSKESRQICKVPIELVYDGNSIIEADIPLNINSNLISFQNTVQKQNLGQDSKSKYSISQFQENDNQKAYFSSTKDKEVGDEDRDQKQTINILKQEIKKITQENLGLKKQLSNQINEYQILERKHINLEKKYVTLQNQKSQPSSSCNSSLIILQEDKNQFILHQIANNSSTKEVQNTHTNQSINSPKNIDLHSKNQVLTIEESLTPSHHKNHNQNTSSSPHSMNAQNNILENISKLYNSITVESQLFTTHQPKPQLALSSQQSIDEDYNYKKNNNNKIDQLLQKGNYSTQLNPSHTQHSKIGSTNNYNSKTQDSFFPSQDKSNFRYIQSNQVKPISIQKQQNNYNTLSINGIADQQITSHENVMDVIHRADEALRKSHYCSSVPYSNEFQQKRNATQYIPK